MNPNESWIAEQARLLMLEDGFGPSSSTRSGGPSGAVTGGDDSDASNGRSSA
jgi:hypothetical protein